MVGNATGYAAEFEFRHSLIETVPIQMCEGQGEIAIAHDAMLDALW